VRREILRERESEAREKRDFESAREVCESKTNYTHLEYRLESLLLDSNIHSKQTHSVSECMSESHTYIYYIMQYCVWLTVWICSRFRM